MAKPVENAISFVIYRDPGKNEFLVVKRPVDDEDLPDVWGLPAGIVREGESDEGAVLRSGREKLGVQLRIGNELNKGTTERKDYILFMKLYTAEIVSGEPAVPQNIPGVTRYQTWKWGKAEDLREAVSKGSLCCRLFIELNK